VLYWLVVVVLLYWCCCTACVPAFVKAGKLYFAWMIECEWVRIEFVIRERERERERETIVVF
jgi:hypothetical protein